MCPAQGEADARFSDRRRGHQARLPRGRRRGDRAVPARRRGRGMGSAARPPQRWIPRAGARASGVRTRAGSGLDDERWRRGVLLSRPDAGPGPAQCSSRGARPRRLDRGGDRDPRHRPAGIAGAARARRRRDPRSHVRRHLRLDDGGVRTPAVPRSQAGAGVAAGAGQARHRHRAAEPHRAGAARLEPAHAQSAIALLAAPHRCSNIAGLGRGRSGGPVRVPQAVQARNPERRAARPAEVRTRAADRARARSRRAARALLSRSTGMKTFFFHLMPYADLDLSYTEHHNSAWVTLPNSYFDPAVGQKLYARYIGELELADQLGFDGICVNEHHQTAYGLMPAPNLIAAALARSTKQAKIAILGRALPLVSNPVAVAEEFAMLDQMSGGRIITGFVRGIGTEYFASGINPTHSHGRYYEAHELILRAWTETGPFRYHGRHYQFDYVNLWPRPLQQHPPVWIPSQGSSETVEWCASAQRKYTYLQTFSPVKSAKKAFDLYRQVAERGGYESQPSQLGW